MGEAYHDNAPYESPYLDSTVAVFALLAHPTRVKIILALRGMEMSASRLADIVDLPAEQVGNELAALESAGVVARERDGRRDFYQLANGHAGSLAANAIFHAQHQADSQAGAATR